MIAIAIGVFLAAYLVRRTVETQGQFAPDAYMPSMEGGDVIDMAQWEQQGQGDAAADLDTMPDQLPGMAASVFNRAAEALQDIPQSLGLAAMPDPDRAGANVAAFLDTIAYAEGTAGPNGYRTLFGGALFSSFADHPRVFKAFTDQAGRQLKSSAAGRYQFLARTWDSLAARLGLADFGPDNQDAAAVELIREAGALSDVRAGRFLQAIPKVARIWASLPGAGYKQPERKLTDLQTAYLSAGGNLEA